MMRDIKNCNPSSEILVAERSQEQRPARAHCVSGKKGFLAIDIEQARLPTSCFCADSNPPPAPAAFHETSSLESTLIAFAAATFIDSKNDGVVVELNAPGTHLNPASILDKNSEWDRAR